MPIISFAALFECSPNAYMLLDRELRYVAANAAYCREVHVDRDDLIGRSLLDIFPNDPADPVLTIHTTSDPLVLGSDVTIYEVLASLAGASDRFVARFVDATGHCNFTPGQTGHAFDALRSWAKSGVRPAAGEQK